MNLPRKIIQDNQQAIELSKTHIKSCKEKNSGSCICARYEPSRNPSSNHSLCATDDRYQQTVSLIKTDSQTPVYSITSRNLNMQSSKEDQTGELKHLEYTRNCQSIVAENDSREGSLSEDSEESFSNYDDDSISPFDINFLLNPDPQECSFDDPNGHHGESSQHSINNSPIQSTFSASPETLSTNTAINSLIEFQKLKFVHFQSSLNPPIEEKGYRCTVCRREFQRPSTLRTHMYSHTGEKPFHCSFEGCSKRFSVESNMRRHLRLHYTPNQRARSPRRRKTWVHTFTHHYNG
ncbi:hypothetical protein K7432_004658 [Basidiobolus ranarum]|uniref:C2H2-type domain-containing protein n=1 Tax=Basidiobolus ranarum TaxID=34480 RepID=A0ABR2WXS3_9FUNG